MFCKNCGTQLPDEAKFCNKCGAKISAADGSPCHSCPEPVAPPEMEQFILPDNSHIQVSPSFDAEPVRTEADGSKGNTAKLPPDRPNGETSFCFCEKCRTILKPNTETCPVCGSWVGDPSGKPGADSICCRNCRNTVKPGQKFCTNCGAAITEQPNASPAAAGSNPTAKKTFLHGISRKTKIIIAAAIAALHVLVLFCSLAIVLFFALNFEKYDSALIEANTAYGLSTSVSLDEYISRYNSLLVDLGVSPSNSGYDLWLYGGIIKSELTVVPCPELGMTQYVHVPAYVLSDYSTLDWSINIFTDTQTGYITAVEFCFDRSQMDSAYITESAKWFANTHAEIAIRSMSKLEDHGQYLYETLLSASDNGGHIYKKGLAFSSSYSSSSDRSFLSCFCITEEQFEEWLANKQQ